MLDFMLIDAFADSPFRGNPAAVVRETPSDDALLQRIAMEFNQAETAYVSRRSDGKFSLRWFAPKAEVALCGHATLAAARALFEWGDARGDRVTFVTQKAGELACARDRDGMLTLDFPATPPAACPVPENAQLTLGLVPGASIECVGRTDMNLMLVLEGEAQVRAASPDFRRLSSWHPVGVIVTARSAMPGVDFVSRFFAPAVGIDEDPATGSSHCALAVHWSRVLGKTTMLARQLSSRGASIGVAVRDARIEIAGQTFITARGQLCV